MGPHRLHRFDRRHPRRALYRALCRRQARRDRADANIGAGDRQGRHHRERRVSELHRDADARTSGGAHRGDDQAQRNRSARHAHGQESARPFHHAARSRRHGTVAVHRRSRQHHRPSHLAVGRRDMVSAPLPAIAELKESDSKSRLRLWIRLLRASRLIESVARERLKVQFNATLPRFDVMAALYRKPDGMLMSEISRFLMVSNGNVTGIVDRLVSDSLVARAQRNGDRRTSFISLTRKGRVLFAAMAAAHESWVDELLGGLSVRDAEQMSAKLKSFRSDWEGEA